MKNIVFHIDMDSFFAACEQQRRPELRGRAIGIADINSRSVVAAASYEAKRFGVKSAMRIPDALKLCPAIIFVKGDHHYYAEISQISQRVFSRYGVAFERTSIDEGFLDATLTAPRYGGVEKLVAQIKQDLALAVGDYITCSVGAAWTKTIAKWASDRQKPNGLTIVDPTTWPALAPTIKLNEFCGIGRATTAKLARYGLGTLADLQQISAERLRLLFGQQGEWLYDLAQGRGSDFVKRDVDQPPQKSLGHAETFDRDLEYPDAYSAIRVLATTLGSRLRRHRLAGTTLTLTIRYRDFSTYSFRAPLGGPTHNDFVIAKAGRRLLERVANRQMLIRLLGLTLSDLSEARTLTQSLFQEDRLTARLLAACDKISDRYGHHTIQPAVALLNPNTRFDSGITWKRD